VQSRPTQHATASLSILVALVCSSVGAASAKSLFPAIGAEGVTALRVGFSALLLLLIGRPWSQGAAGVRWWSVVGYGVVLGLMNILIYQAFSRLPLGIAVAIEVMGPLAVALLYSRRRLDILWVIISAIGLFLLLPISVPSDLDPVGLLFAFGAASCWAIYILLGRAVSRMGPTRAVSLGMVVAAVFAVPFGVYRASGALLDGRILLVGFLVAILSSAIPYLLEMFAFRRLSSGIAGVLLSAAPGISAAVGVAVLGEHLTLMQWMSVALIMSGSAGCAILSVRTDAAH
jgi:inner membrane transporter RhtA